MVDNQMGDRQRGILSPADREFLIATNEEREENYTRQARAKRQRAIRNRVYEAVLDFIYLLEFWPSEYREDVFDDLVEEWQGRAGLADMMSLIYIELTQRDQFDDIFGRGVRQAEERLHDEQTAAYVSVRPIDEIVEWLDKTTIAEAIVKVSQERHGLVDLTADETRAIAHLLYYSEVGLEELEDALEQPQRVEYEQRGGGDYRRKSEWIRNIHRNKELRNK